MSNSRIANRAIALAAAGAMGAGLAAAPAIAHTGKAQGPKTATTSTTATTTTVAHTPVRARKRPHTLKLTGTVTSVNPKKHQFVLAATNGSTYTIRSGRLPKVGEVITVTVHKLHKGLYETSSYKLDKKAPKKPAPTTTSTTAPTTPVPTATVPTATVPGTVTTAATPAA